MAEWQLTILKEKDELKTAAWSEERCREGKSITIWISAFCSVSLPPHTHTLSYFQDVCIQLWKMLAPVTVMNIRAIQSFKGAFGFIDAWIKRPLWNSLMKHCGCSSQNVAAAPLSPETKIGLCGCEALMKRPHSLNSGDQSSQIGTISCDEPVTFQLSLMWARDHSS